MPLFKEARFPQGAPGFKEGIRRRLREVVIGGAAPDERTLAQSAGWPAPAHPGYAAQPAPANAL